MIGTYSFAEVAAAVLPSEWTDAERWLRRRLNRGEAPGSNVSRECRTTKDDAAEFITTRHRSKMSPAAATEPEASPAPSAIASQRGPEPGYGSRDGPGPTG